MCAAACALAAAGCGAGGGARGGGPPDAAVRTEAPAPEPQAESGDGGGGDRAHRPAHPEHRAADPVRVRIPAISVSAAVGPLALGTDRTLATPENPARTGWWRDGPEPGEAGPAVIVGHYDSDTGPAVFHRLRDLRAGDRIYVDRTDGTTAAFRAAEITSHRQSAFPTARVYGDTNGRAALRLITCTGPYDRAAGHYLENLVVYADLTASGDARSR